MHYNAKTVLYFVGYSYIMHLINAQKTKHIKSKKKLRLLYLFIFPPFFSPPLPHNHTGGQYNKLKSILFHSWSYSDIQIQLPVPGAKQ